MSARMAAFAFVAVFIALGLGALFWGLRSGSKGPDRKPVSRRGRRGATLLFLLLIVLLGIAIPAAVIATDKNRNSIPEANVKSLTSVQEHGRELFAQRCKNCHTLAAAKATARVGPNLDVLRPPKALVLDAINKGRANGNGNMAAQLVDGEDAEAVAQFVAVAVGNSPK
jgi:mono/diheme cytochrome c family protein